MFHEMEAMQRAGLMSRWLDEELSKEQRVLVTAWDWASRRLKNAYEIMK